MMYWDVFDRGSMQKRIPETESMEEACIQTMNRQGMKN